MKRLGLAAVLLLALLLPATAGATLTLPPSLWYWTDGDRVSKTVTAPVTRAKAQAVLDLANDTTHLYIQFGVGELGCDSTLWLHGNTSLYGMGHGLTRFKRTRFSESDPAGAGDVVCTARWRMHAQNNGLSGGIPTDSLADIEVVGVTIDGNFQAWPTLNPNGPRNFGLSLFYVNRPLVRDVEIKSTGQSGCQIYGCRDAIVDWFWVHDVGQELMLGTRNGINFNDNPTAPTWKTWGSGATLTNFFITNQKDAAVGVCNVSNVSISKGFLQCDHDTTYGNIGFEFEGAISGYTMENFHISDVRAVGLNNQFWTFNITSCNLKNVAIEHCYFYQGGSTVDASRGRWPIFLKNSNAGITFRGLRISDCVFENLNAGGGVATGGFMKMYTQNAPGSGDWKFTNLIFRGANQAHADVNNDGVALEGYLDDVSFTNVRLEGCEAYGFHLKSAAGTKLKNVTLRDCYVRGAQLSGYLVNIGSNTAQVGEVKLLDCVAEDTNAGGAGYAFDFQSNVNGTVMRNVTVRGCSIVRNSGTNMQGLRLWQSGTGILDSIWIDRNDFVKANGAPYVTTNTPTNVFWDDINNRVLERGEWLYWKNGSGGPWPYIRADSTNSLVLQAQTGGNIRVQKADGTIVGQWAGGSTGDLNVTNGARYQLGGFRTIEKISGTVTIYSHRDTDSTQGVAIRDSAGTKNMARFVPQGGLVVPRLGPQSTNATGGAIRIIDGVVFPLTVAGVQAALDEVGTAGGGTVYVPANAGIVMGSVPILMPNRTRLVGMGDHGSPPTFSANGSTNVRACITNSDTTGSQAYAAVENIGIYGGRDLGGRMDAGIKLKRIFVGSYVRDVNISTLTGVGLRVEGNTSQSVGQMVFDNVTVANTSDYGVLVNSGASSVWFDHLTAERPGRNMAAVKVDGTTTTSAPNACTRFAGLYTEVTDTMSVGVLVDGASGVEIDGYMASKAGGRFRSAVKIQNSVPGNFAFSPSGLTIRNLYTESDTLVEDVPNSTVYDVGPSPSNPYRHMAWWTSPVAVGTVSGNGYRNSNQVVGLQPARLGPDVASAASLQPHNDGGSAFNVTGTTTVTAIVGMPAFLYKATVFIVQGACKFTYGGNLHLNGDFTGPGQLTLMWNGSYWAELARSPFGATAVSLVSSSPLGLWPITFANLGTPANGTLIFCSDCTKPSDPATGGGTGGLAVRANGRWYVP